MRYFRIKIGYGHNEYVSIDETELEKAYGVFLTDGKGVFSGGVVRGQDIIAIQEDWNRAMGYNPEWKLTADDRVEIEKTGVMKQYKGLLAQTSRKVQYLVQNNQQHLIGKNVAIPELEVHDHKALSEGSKALADKMSIKNKK